MATGIDERMTMNEAQEFVRQQSEEGSYPDSEWARDKQQLSYLCQALVSLSPATVLNICPRYGVLAVWLQSRGWDVTVIDEASSATDDRMPILELAGIRYEFINVEVGRLLETFKVIVFPEGLQYVSGDAEAALKNAGKMLDSDGLFIASITEDDERVSNEGWAGPQDKHSLHHLLSSQFDLVQTWQPWGSDVVLAQAKYPSSNGKWF